MIQLRFNRNKCIGCGLCAEYHPSRWRMNYSDGKAALVNGVLKGGTYNARVPLEEQSIAEKVAIHCPVHVIQWQQ